MVDPQRVDEEVVRAPRMLCKRRCPRGRAEDRKNGKQRADERSGEGARAAKEQRSFSWATGLAW
jgi:hypothetical protein